MDASPLVLLDVDGVLNPLSARRGYRSYRKPFNGTTLTVRLNRRDGSRLTRLAESTGAELVWATFWKNDANTWVAPKIGLPRLRYIPIPACDPDVPVGVWKARHVTAWVGSTPFVWLEDEPDVPDVLADEAGLGPYLVVGVDPLTGLTDEHIERARTWLDRYARTA